MFQDLIDGYCRTTGGKNPSPYQLTDEELADLIVTAKVSKDVHPSVWAKFRRVLTDHTDLDKAGVSATFRECRITADLGAYPYSVLEFVPLFLKSRSYRMKFSGVFTNDADFDYIYGEMTMWSHEIIGCSPIFADSQIATAFKNWQVTERKRLLAEAYRRVQFDAAADDLELEAFATYITASSPDPDKTARDVRATVIALRNFIFRVKNHIRGRWCHGVHMMPVLYGPQGSGKTTAVRHLLQPLAEFSSAVGFDIFDHDAKSFALSVTPIMFFDELAGITKAENEKLKDIMHTENRELRQLYGKPSTRTLVSTFIGCTNRPIDTLIKDETGNRRYLQVDTPKIAREEIMKFDALAMWRSVDEEGEPPLYANAENLKAIEDVQLEQRHIGKVEMWIASYQRTNRQPISASEYFSNHYLPWLKENYPNQDRYDNVVMFGRELARLHRAGNTNVKISGTTSNKLYLIGQAAAPRLVA